MSKALVPYKPRSLARREPRDLERHESPGRIVTAGELPPGDGDVGEAALHILLCCRQLPDVFEDSPEVTVAVQLLTQTEVAAGELLETQHRGKVKHKDGKWYFEQERGG